MANRPMPEKPDEEKVVEKVTVETVETRPIEPGKVEVRRASAMQAIVDDITNTFVHDVIVPTVQDLLLKLVHGVTSTIDAYSEEAIQGKKIDKRKFIRDRGSSKPSYSGWTDYRKAGSTSAERNSLDGSLKPRVISSKSGPVDVSQVLFKKRETAESVLSALIGNAMRYGWARMDDFYRNPLVDLPANEQDIYFGWDPEMLRSGEVKQTYRGFYISLPQPAEIPQEERQ